MGQNEIDALLFDVANYEDWNVLSIERRIELGLRPEMRTQAQLQYILEEEEDCIQE